MAIETTSLNCLREMSWGARRPFIQGKDLQNLKLTDEDKQFYFEFKSKTEGL